jgi:peptidoglycan/LPS O-acetylase OafA/YrhL
MNTEPKLTFPTTHQPVSAGRPRLSSLTSLRFIAAAGIVAVHSLFITSYLGTARLTVFVSFFFVLSGFVLTWSWSDGRVRDFYRNRFARIYPVYLCAWVLGLIVTLLQGTPTSLGTMIATGTLTQAWVPLGSTYFGVNGAAWSLSCEAFFYLCFPLIVVALTRATVRQRRQLLVGCLLFSIVYMTVLGNTPPGTFWTWATYICPLARLPEFVAGMVLALEVRDGWRCPSWVVIPAVAFSAAVLPFVPSWSQEIAVTIVPFVLIIAAAASADLRGVRSVLHWRLMVALGGASYCLYLVHLPLYGIANLVTHEIWTVPTKVIGIAAVSAGALTIAQLLHRYVEQPAEKRLRARPSKSYFRSDNDHDTSSLRPELARRKVGKHMAG